MKVIFLLAVAVIGTVASAKLPRHRQRTNSGRGRSLVGSQDFPAAPARSYGTPQFGANFNDAPAFNSAPAPPPVNGNGFAAVAQNGYSSSNEFGSSFNGNGFANGGLLAAASDVSVDPIQELGANIPGGGIPGEDYPILASVPETDFSCGDQEVPGYYADTSDEARCQVFHICQDGGRKDSFLCPNGTLFQQQYFVCDWWFNVDCSAAQDFFSLNSEIGRVADDFSASNDQFVSQSGSPFDTSFNDPFASPSNLYSAPNANSARSFSGRRF